MNILHRFAFGLAIDVICAAAIIAIVITLMGCEVAKVLGAF